MELDQETGSYQMTLANLRENGYETAAAQEKLDEITAMRSMLADALRARDDSGIEEARHTIHEGSVGLALIVRDLQKSRTASQVISAELESGEETIAASATLDTRLADAGINTSAVEPGVADCTSSLARAQLDFALGRISDAGTDLEDLPVQAARLRDAYRTLQDRPGLPDALSADLQDQIRQLDSLAEEGGTG